MKRARRMFTAALLVYALLIWLLLLAESASPEAGIRSVGDALWYSLITMTTVGYGDLTPVTPLGRAVGLLFALLSLGVLTALIAFALRLVSGELIPRLRLRLARRQNWFVFDGAGSEAVTLADALMRRDRHALCVFPAAARGAVPGAVCLNADADALSRLRDGREGMLFFYLDPNDPLRYSRAADTAQRGFNAYCLTELSPSDDSPAALHLFHPAEAMARRYWKEHPLLAAEDCIVLIGGGSGAEALLERALLANVFPRGRRIEYHCFSFGDRFLQCHPELTRSLSDEGDDADRLVFHAESFTEAAELLRRASRVILCDESDEENLRADGLLRSWFVCGGKVHLKTAKPLPGENCFGLLADTLTPEAVLRGELDRRAMLLNEIYNEDAAAPKSWNELGSFLRQANVAAADHLSVKRRILLGDETDGQTEEELFRRAFERFETTEGEERELLRETEHRRWLRFYRLYNWRYAPERDDAARLHPLIVPYAELSPEERRKDDYAWLLLGKLAEKNTD